MKRIQIIFGLSMFSLASYVMFVRGFDKFSYLEIAGEWQGCYISEYGSLHLEDDLLKWGESQEVSAKAGMSQDNIGYFIQLDPSVNFDISKDGKIFTHHAGKGKYKGLRLEKEAEIDIYLRIPMTALS